jgi:CO/xanthine dehydrogenase Mo-binding subunit
VLLDEIDAKDMIYAVLLRSPAAKGVFKGVDAPASGVCSIVSSSAIDGENRLAETDMPVLAQGCVMYKGEPLAIITAPRESEACHYASLCKPIIEEETPSFSMETFTKNDIFENFKDAAQYDDEGEDGGVKEEFISTGNTYQTGVQYQWPSEMCGATAEIDGDFIRIYVSAVNAAYIQESVALCLGIQPDKVKVTLLPALIHFDLKTVHPAHLACCAALAAKSSKKKTRLLLSRDEEYMYAPKRSRARFRVTSKETASGSIQTLNVEARFDYGAYNLWKTGFNGAQSAICESFSPFETMYEIKDLKCSGYAVRTNLPPAFLFCGGGLSQGFFTLENHVSAIAEKLKMNGVEWRKKNFNKNETFFSKKDRKEMEIILDKIAISSGYIRKSAAYKTFVCGGAVKEETIIPRRGVGIAVASYSAPYTLKDGSGPFRPNREAGKKPASVFLQAACVLEVEIDKIDYNTVMRGVWIFISASFRREGEKPQDAFLKIPPDFLKVMRRAVLQGADAAIGWSAFEKCEYINADITPDSSADYQMIRHLKEFPVKIEFIKNSSPGNPGADCFLNPQDDFFNLTEALRGCAFNVLPSAFLQAVSMASGHEFVKIPLYPVNIWNFLHFQKKESKGQTPEGKL